MQRGQAGPVSAIPRGTLTQTGVAEISNKGALHPVTPAGPKHIFLLPSYLKQTGEHLAPHTHQR